MGAIEAMIDARQVMLMELARQFPGASHVSAPLKALDRLLSNRRHSGQSKQSLQRRRELYLQAQKANPTRWSRHVRRWEEPNHVWLNKREKEKTAA